MHAPTKTVTTQCKYCKFISLSLYSHTTELARSYLPSHTVSPSLDHCQIKLLRCWCIREHVTWPESLYKVHSWVHNDVTTTPSCQTHTLIWQLVFQNNLVSPYQTNPDFNATRGDGSGAGANCNSNNCVESSIQISTTNKPTPSFLQDGCPFCHPTNSVKALQAPALTIVQHNTGKRITNIHFESRAAPAELIWVWIFCRAFYQVLTETKSW